MNKTLVQLIAEITKKLRPRYAAQEAEVIALQLIAAITKKSTLELVVKNYSITDDEQQTIDVWLHEHIHNNKPLQYLIGSVPFINCTILVEPPVLIPRPETEEWVFNLIQKLGKVVLKKISILDIGTGSGAIACALAKNLPNADVIATDISTQALHLAKKNAVMNGVAITFVHSNLFEHIQGKKFDLIVSNPPYIDPLEWNTLDPTVKLWEDYHALVAHENGLEIIRKIIESAQLFLTNNSVLRQNKIPQLCIEIGYNQGNELSALMKNHFSQVEVVHDYNVQDRLVCGYN